MKKTTCPLDCYDACSIVLEEGKLKGDKNHPLTNGVLCPSLNCFLKQKRIETATIHGKEVSMEEALEYLKTKLKENLDKPSLFFKGSGNFGFLQDTTAKFFEKYGSTFTKGSLCDGAGEMGVEAGRGVSLSLPISEIKKSEVVVVWGRNITVSNSHMVDIIKDKTIIVIDPVKTSIAKKADIHIQLKPKTDFYLALLWARFILIEDIQDDEFIEKYTEEFDYFKDFIQGFGINKLIDTIGLKVSELLPALELMKGKKTVFLVGVGVQKYLHGDEVLRSIDAVAALLGLFGKEGSGVSYLANSSFGFTNPFMVTPKKRVSKATLSFSEYKTVFIQGANPLQQMPDTNRVKEGLDKSEFVVYFGLYENETSKMADLVLPAKTFLEKDDVRCSYGSEFVALMPKLVESDIGISEYKLAQWLLKSFSYEPLDSEQSYIEDIVNSNSIEKDGQLISKTYEQIPYSEGFYTDSGKFIFMDEIEDKEEEEEEGFYLITSKSKHTINSQFKIDNFLYISDSLDFKDGEKVLAHSKWGEATFEVKLSPNLREDCIKITSGAKNVNSLTPTLKNNYGDSAVFQEVKVFLKKL